MGEFIITDRALDESQSDRPILTNKDFGNLRTSEDLEVLLTARGRNLDKVKYNLSYETQLVKLQVQLVKLQRWIQRTGKRVVIIFEGRDAAGKGGSIKRFIEHLNPRAMRVYQGTP